METVVSVKEHRYCNTSEYLPQRRMRDQGTGQTRDAIGLVFDVCFISSQGSDG